MYLEKGQNILIFHGVDHKVGTTMISQSFAELAAKEDSDKDVLLLALHGRTGTDYIGGPVGFLDQIKRDIDRKVITGEGIKSKCLKKGNLHIMGGIGSINSDRHYHPETADFIIEAIKKIFDIIIIDCGNEIDCGIAVGSLKQHAAKILIMTQQETIINRYEALRDIYIRLNIDFSNIIINKYCQNDPYDFLYLSKRLGTDKSEFIAISKSENGRKAEMEHKSLLNYHDGKYRMEMIKALQKIMSLSEENEKKRSKEGFGWNSFI